MAQPADSADKLMFVEPSPIARRLAGSDRHESFEKPGAHLFRVQSGEGELEHQTGRFARRPGKKVWLVDMIKPRTSAPAPKRHLTIPFNERLDQARLLLADKRLSIKDVATQLNFSSEFYFSQFFRHRSGMSPTQFRQHLKG